MNIPESAGQSKLFEAHISRVIFVGAVLILACLASFALGVLAGRDGFGEGGGVKIEQLPPR